MGSDTLSINADLAASMQVKQIQRDQSRHLDAGIQRKAALEKAKAKVVIISEASIVRGEKDRVSIQSKLKKIKKAVAPRPVPKAVKPKSTPAPQVKRSTEIESDLARIKKTSKSVSVHHGRLLSRRA